MNQIARSKTTVVIPNLNGMKYLENCVHSLREQTCKSFDLIFVENGSTDGSKEWIEQNCPEATLLIFAENKGFCEAVNVGIRKAKTEYVLLLNNDTQVYPDFIEQLEKAMDSMKKCFSVSAQMLEMEREEILDGAGDYYSALGWAYARGKGKKAADYSAEKEIFSACAGAAIYRKSVFEEIGVFDENHFAYLEDLDIGYRAKIYGYKNYYAPLARVKHVGSGFSGSRYNNFKIELSARNNIYLLYKNMPLLQLLLNSPLLLLGFLIKTLFFVKKGYGRIYLAGLKQGILLACSEKGKRKKIPFHSKNTRHYIQIQIALWINLFRRF